MSENMLPDEILVEILQRVSSETETLVRCTAVCKSWRSLITHPSFISTHYRHTPSFLLLQLYDDFGNCSLHHDDPFLIFYSYLRLPQFCRGYSHSLVGLCNGLFCIAASHRECPSLIICNPCVRRYVDVSLPSPHCYTFGFGFDSRNSDYKVVRIACMKNDPDVHVYSLATGLWRNLDDVAPVFTLCSIRGDIPHGFVDGVIHWAAKQRVGDGWHCFVLSFNFEHELFGEVPLPESFAHAFSAKAVVGGNGKALTVYDISYGAPFSCSIWVMKEYGVVESWNKLFLFNSTEVGLEAPLLGTMVMGVTILPSALCVRDSGEVLLLMQVAGKRHLFSLDTEKGLRDVEIEVEHKAWYFYSGYFSHSLVLLDKTTGVVSYRLKWALVGLIYHEGNICADRLAAHGISVNWLCWWDFVPSFVTQFFVNDRQELPLYRFR